MSESRPVLIFSQNFFKIFTINVNFQRIIDQDHFFLFLKLPGSLEAKYE